MNLLEASLRSSPIVDKDEYQYVVNPITDGVPALDPALLREVTVRILQAATLSNVEKIVTPAAMGIHISTAVSLATDIPLVIVRKRKYGLEGEVSLSQVTGYAESEMYLNDVEAGDRVLVLDDLLSTGGTLRALLDTLDEVGADIVDVVAVIRKAGDNELQESHHEVTSLVTIDVVDGEVVIQETE